MDQGRREATECDEPSDRKCPLWIKSGHRIRSASCPRFPESGHRFNALGCPLSAKSRSGARRHPVRLGWGKPVRSSCPASNSGLILTVCAMSSLAPNAIRSTRLLGCNSSPLYRRVAKCASPAFPRANAPNQNGVSANGSAAELVNSASRHPVRRSLGWRKEKLGWRKEK
jgi:hypothetical protein